MGKVTGFIEWERASAERRPVSERLADSREVERPQQPEQLRQQAGRCMDCGVPFCQQGCPLGNPIPDFNDAVYRDSWREAFERLSATNEFPELTGRLCPAPCEASCVLSINSDAVTIEQVEKQIIERAFAEGWVRPRPPRNRSGHTVAVVGSGPAGLAAAARLNRAGHEVTVYEASDRIGGLLRYGIPDFKLEKHVIDRRLEILRAEGVRFLTSVEIGVSPRWNEIAAAHDALLIATGAPRPRDLDVPGRELAGVCFAMDYLEQQNRVVAGDMIPAGERIDAAGKRAIILGGGDTGSDCLGTALRQGAKSVHQVELFPRPPDERRPDNPWPAWPVVFRTSSSQEEGGERAFALMTERLTGEHGQLRALHAVRVAPRRGDDGRTRLEKIPGSETTMDVDLLILAMGFVGPDAATLRDQLGVELDARGNVATGDDFSTSVDSVYCAGDARRGASLIVWAIAEGRDAAAAIDARLCPGMPGRASSRRAASG